MAKAIHYDKYIEKVAALYVPAFDFSHQYVEAACPRAPIQTPRSYEGKREKKKVQTDSHVMERGGLANI